MRVSIVTPSFNQAPFLESCIQSICSQGYSDLEYIVIDGSSTDNSSEILKNNSSLITRLVIEPDRGHWDALNKGFSCSTGQIMGWLNSDDLMLPWALSTINDIFTTFPEVEWIQGLQGFWNKNGQITSSCRAFKHKYDYMSGNYKWIQQESTFWRRSLWDKAGGFISSEYKYMVDGELWSRFFQHAKLYHLECLLSGYRIHGANRAQLQMNDIISEMDNIVQNMRQRACTSDLWIANCASLATSLASSFLGRKLRVGRRLRTLSAKALLGSSYANLAYDAIDWDYSSNQWRLKTLSW